MKKILLFALSLMVMCAVSCGKNLGDGTINATTTYVGELPQLTDDTTCEYYICDLSQQDFIETLTQQIHDAYSNSNYQGCIDLAETLKTTIPVFHREFCMDSHLAYNITAGTYILMSERDIYCAGGIAPMFKYKMIQVESDKTTSVAFVFDDIY